MIEREFKYIKDWGAWYLDWHDYYFHPTPTLPPSMLYRYRIDRVLANQWSP